jgi:hypothetical protein
MLQCLKDSDSCLLNAKMGADKMEPLLLPLIVEKLKAYAVTLYRSYVARRNERSREN